MFSAGCLSTSTCTASCGGLNGEAVLIVSGGRAARAAWWDELLPKGMGAWCVVAYANMAVLGAAQRRESSR